MIPAVTVAGAEQLLEQLFPPNGAESRENKMAGIDRSVREGFQSTDKKTFHKINSAKCLPFPNSMLMLVMIKTLINFDCISEGISVLSALLFLARRP